MIVRGVTIRKVTWVALSLIFAAIAARCQHGVGPSPQQLAAQAERAFREGEAERGLRLYLELHARDPEGLDIARRLDEAMDRTLLQQVLHENPALELEVIRLFAEQEDGAALARVLAASLVRIPAGEFTMGDDEGAPDERPARTIHLDVFEIDRYEVTNAQYQRFLLNTDTPSPRHWRGDEYPEGMDDYPAVGMSWQQADDFCRWAGKRLPTEAEWEKACRGPGGAVYPWGDVWEPGLANNGFSRAQDWPSRLDSAWGNLQLPAANEEFLGTYPVGSFPAGRSPYGVADLAGNVSEWVFDWYNWDGYGELPAANPVGLGPPWNHVLRGSAWFYLKGHHHLVPLRDRCSNRGSSHSYDDPRVGFRCARSVPAEGPEGE